jgi:hypothetical protein
MAMRGAEVRATGSLSDSMSGSRLGNPALGVGLVGAAAWWEHALRHPRGIVAVQSSTDRRVGAEQAKYDCEAGSNPARPHCFGGEMTWLLMRGDALLNRRG